MSSFAPGTPWEVIDEVNKRFYGATRDPQPYNPPANAPLAGTPGMQSLLGGLFGTPPQGGPNQMDAVLRAIGVPPAQPLPSMGVGGTGKGGNPVGTYNPGFLGMPMPSSPQGPLPDISTMLPALPPMPPRGGPVQSLPPMPPQMPPQMPVAGMTPAPTPPQMPSYTNPNQPPSGETVPPQSQYGVPTSSDGKWLFNDGRWMPNNTATTFPMPESRPEEVFPGQQPQGQGLDVQKLLAMLRAMQSRRQPSPTPQPPQGREGSTRMGPSPTMRGSGMGLEGILRGIEASRGSR